MSMFQVGDVVVCVDDSPCKCAKCAAGLRDPRVAYVRGKTYRVIGIGSGRASTDSRPLVLLLFPGVAWRAGHSPGANSERFRKIERATDAFTAQIRACRPAHRKTPVPAA